MMMIRDILKSFLYVERIQLKERRHPEKLKQYQFKLLKETLNHAFTRIPYYRDTYRKAGIDCRDIRSWEDFRGIPLLTKQTKRDHPPEYFLPEGIDKKKIWKSQTTGSSGIPITVFRNRESAAWDRALIHYCFHTLGIKIHHRFCQIAAHIEEKPQPPGPLARLGIKRNFVVNLRQSDEEIVREIKKLKIDVIFTFPSVLLRLAEYVQSQGVRLPVKAMIAQGEVLPESWRTAIQKAFNAPLFHTYGATELARVGFECRQQHGYHLIADAAVTEVLADDGRPAAPGEEGNLIVTNLNNKCSPLIRYQIGDRGVLSASRCPCGITYPLLENVTGRMDDYIILPSGRRVSARAVTHMQFDGITQYKIVQKTPSHLQVLVVPSKNFGVQTLQQMEKILAGAFLDEPLNVEIKQTDSLPLSRTGKLQLVSREF